VIRFNGFFLSPGRIERFDPRSLRVPSTIQPDYLISAPIWRSTITLSKMTFKVHQCKLRSIFFTQMTQQSAKIRSN
jgi:hypothetical protein